MPEHESSISVLIPVAQNSIGNETVPTVNARDVHAYLGITKPYSTWIKTQIRRSHLLENQDYIVFSPEGKNPQGGRPLVEYHLTFDAVKHVAMLSSAEKGHEVRAYFIAKEKELVARTYPHVKNPSNQLIIDTVIRIDALEQEQEIQRQMLVAQQAAQMAAQVKVIEAFVTATQADTKATLAIDAQQWLTIRQFVYLNHLEAQFPPQWQKDYGRWLTTYCQEKGIPVMKQTVADATWKSEHAYHVTAIQETHGSWITRRITQPSLAIVGTSSREGQ